MEMEEMEEMQSMCNPFKSKLFLFLLDGNIRDRQIRTMSTNLVRKVAELFCMQESDISLFLQVSV